MKTITFDLETVYDEEYEGRTEFPPLPAHYPVVGSFLVNGTDLTTFSADQGDGWEQKMIAWLQYELGDVKLDTRLISWNGMKFDVPVMLLRAMSHKLTLSQLSKYRHRYHDTHFDMKLRITNGESRSYSLDSVSKLLGYRGKHLVSGGKVQQLWKYEKEYEAVRRYCEEDVLGTYLIYLSWMRTYYGAHNVESAEERVQEMLKVRYERDAEYAKQRIRDGKPSLTE